MASLKSLLATKSDAFATPEQEQNLEKGRIYTYNPGTNYSRLWCCFCFHPEESGIAVVDIWGAGGSGAEMCCCGVGLAGNSGAYTRRTVVMAAGDYIEGRVGIACGNSDSLCFRGCSEATCVRYCISGICTCTCTEGGRGGISFCSTNSSFYCCYRANGFCYTRTDNDNCGIICNKCNGSFEGRSFNGDINCPSRLSCVSAFGCYPTCICMFNYHIPTPYGQFSLCGNKPVFANENRTQSADWSGQGRHQHVATLGSGRWPTGGSPFSTCWGKSGACNCYNNEGCVPVMPYGTGGMGPFPCPGVRDHATRGGHGTVRIKFIR